MPGRDWGSAADRYEVTELVARYMALVDRRDYPGIRACLADEVLLDYTSLRPDTAAAVQNADAIIPQWRARHAGIPGLQHHMGSIAATVTGDTATCVASGISTHRKQDQAGHWLIWQVGGLYDYRMTRGPDGWRIAAITMTKLWERSEPNP